MRGKTPVGNLTPLDLEIEATCRRNNIEKKRRDLQERITNPSGERILSPESSSSFPADLRGTEVGASEANTMAEYQPQRVTLEDYSNSTVPQFFLSIAWPEVQATNILYLHSLIQLIQGNLFHGLPNEDPYAHLAMWEEVVGNF